MLSLHKLLVVVSVITLTYVVAFLAASASQGAVLKVTTHGVKANQNQPASPPYALIRLAPGRPNLLTTMTPAESQIVEEHSRYLVALRGKGIVLHAGRTTDPARLWGIVVMRATEARARELMSGDPAIKAGLQTFEAFPYLVAIDGR